MKTNLVLILTATLMPLLSGTALAGEKTTVFNNRGQVTATVNAVNARPAAAPATEKKLVWNNRGQLIAVVQVPAR
ncbi:hypothetical protein SAMN02745166_02352 [Prosthecobacter debontii]|uniref:YD repeat-containing protein n=1 Tax=Prosthecobacter debontii TaxID=48467 RepID=A0A1T4Y3M4_9BACT|nr:hypothetical protein [Prosthecobacter debontii]SKA96098.1 hypothetical protein SAMN02745166_02352 [Prosthecobacter debontii]